MKIIYLKIAIFILFVFVWPLGVNAKNPDDMILISTGKFVMGLDQGADDAKPAHHVFLDAFLIDLHEVTQKAFEKIMGYNPSKFSGEIRPVENMDWFEANDGNAMTGQFDHDNDGLDDHEDDDDGSRIRDLKKSKLVRTTFG